MKKGDYGTNERSKGLAGGYKTGVVSGRFSDSHSNTGLLKSYSLPDGKIVPRLKPGVLDRANAALRSK